MNTSSTPNTQTNLPHTPVLQAVVPLAGTAIAFVALLLVGAIGGTGLAMTMLMP